MYEIIKELVEIEKERNKLIKKQMEDAKLDKIEWKKEQESIKDNFDKYHSEIMKEIERLENRIETNGSQMLYISKELLRLKGVGDPFFKEVNNIFKKRKKSNTVSDMEMSDLSDTIINMCTEISEPNKTFEAFEFENRMRQLKDIINEWENVGDE